MTSTRLLNLIIKEDKAIPLPLTNAKWRKVRHYFLGMMRFKNQEVIKISDPDDIIDQISNMKIKKKPPINKN